MSKTTPRRWWNERGLPIPSDRDARCGYCFCPYTFANAHVVQTQDWRRFCSPDCEQAAKEGKP
jgi:hypothetical protein